MEFTLNSANITSLINKNKLYAQLSSSLTSAYFKLEQGKFTFMLRGFSGAVQTTLPINYEGDTFYFSVDFNKWVTVLQKFIYSDMIYCNITKNFLKLSNNPDSNTINLGITDYNKDSSEAIVLDSFINTKKDEIIAQDISLDVNEDILEKLRIADSLFITQGKINSVGLSSKDIMYSDRSVVLRAKLIEPINEDFFRNLTDETYVYLHTSLIKILALTSRTNSKVWFNNDYSIVFWEDDDSKLIFASGDREIALPTEEQFLMIQPSSKDNNFNVSLNTLREGLDFFAGFYDGSIWKPIGFEATANKSVSLHYQHPTTEISNDLPGISPTATGSFKVDSDTLTKILVKLQGQYEEDKDMLIVFDNEAPGIYCNVDDIYEFILSKLDEDEE